MKFLVGVVSLWGRFKILEEETSRHLTAVLLVLAGLASLIATAWQCHI